MKGERPEIVNGELIELPDRWLVRGAHASAESVRDLCIHAREGFDQDPETGARRRIVVLDLAWLIDGDVTQLWCVSCALDSTWAATSKLIGNRRREGM